MEVRAKEALGASFQIFDRPDHVPDRPWKIQASSKLSPPSTYYLGLFFHPFQESVHVQNEIKQICRFMCCSSSAKGSHRMMRSIELIEIK